MSELVARLKRLLTADRAVLVGFLLLAGLAFVFLELASEVLEGETIGLDRLILQGLRTSTDATVPIGPGWLRVMMVDITALGDVTGLTLITLAVVGFLTVSRKYATALFVAASVVGGATLGTVLKAIFARPRPDLVPHLVEVTNASFPSGHAMNSAVVFLTLGALLARTQERWAVRIYLVVVAIVLTLLVGVSRVFLGVHWPTDVVAGWCVGAAWATGCGLLARWLQHRSRIEPPGEEAA